MYFNSVMQWKHIITNELTIIVALFFIMHLSHFKAVVGLFYKQKKYFNLHLILCKLLFEVA